MKLRINRFRTRRPDLPDAPAPANAGAPPPAARPRPVTIADNAFFPEPGDDGFTEASYRKPAAAPAPAAAARKAPNPAPNPAPDPAPPGAAAAGTTVGANLPHELEAIRRESLTGRQLRMARRLALKHNLPATSDFDAVRLLRKAGIDPFQANSILELVSAQGASAEGPPPGSRALALASAGGAQLPQTVKPIQVPSTEVQAEHAHIAEIGRIQRAMADRRKRKSMLLSARLLVFVGLPTLLAALYFYTVATPLYATKTEFVIQHAEPAAAAGVGSLLRGTQLATSQDSIAVQGYLQSFDAMERLDKDQGFRAAFSDPAIDPVQRLAENASNSAAYKVYRRNVKISYDPTEGIIKMEVIAPDPQTAVTFSKALISYAEDQVEGLTRRLREDQMTGARQSFDETEAKLKEANQRVIELQEKYKVLSSEVEISLITTQIGALDAQLSQDRLSLAQMESNASPNKARMEPLKRRIGTLESEIAELRSKLTEDSASGLSLARVQSELLVAQADVATRQLLLGQSMAAMESARIEASRQTRYLSISVNPVPPDEAAYPRAFENTLVVLLIFAGLYLMISMTFAILREQMTA